MRRREFVTWLGGTAAACLLSPRAALAQENGTKTIGFLVLDNPDPAQFISQVQAALRGLGYSEGHDIRFEIRIASDQAASMAGLATELVALKVDLIVAFATPAAVAAKQATKDIPIVMLVADPTDTGLIDSFARPGGNITGVSSDISELGAKNLDVLRELLPSVRRVAALANANDPFQGPFIDHIQAASAPLHVEIKSVMVRNDDELENDFADIATWRADAALVQPSLALQRIADLALQHRLPTACAVPVFSKFGGLIAYAGDFGEQTLRVASFIDKILKGSKPASLPVELPTKFWLSVNLKTARTIGVAVPETILATADEVIE